MNRALGISNPCNPCVFVVSVRLLRNKTFGRRMSLRTLVLLEIQPELGRFLKSYLRKTKLELSNPFQAKLPSCLQFFHHLYLCFIFVPDEFSLRFNIAFVCDMK